MDTQPATRAVEHLPFLTWARRTKVLPPAIRLPPVFSAPSDLHTDPERRWAVARRLVQDDTFDIVDLVAGAMVVLYAQPMVRICALTTDNIAIDGGIVSVRLGGDRLTRASRDTDPVAPAASSPGRR